jgi:hypothetical protein
VSYRTGDFLKTTMNMGQNPIDRSQRMTAEPLRHLLIGTRSDIQATIDHLCTLHFCDHAEWSKIQPHPTRPNDFLSTMTKWRV